MSFKKKKKSLKSFIIDFALNFTTISFQCTQLKNPFKNHLFFPALKFRFDNILNLKGQCKDQFWLGLQNRIGLRPNKPKQ